MTQFCFIPCLLAICSRLVRSLVHSLFLTLENRPDFAPTVIRPTTQYMRSNMWGIITTIYPETVVIIRLLGRRKRVLSNMHCGDRNSSAPSTMRSPGDRILLPRRRVINSSAVRRRGRLLIAQAKRLINCRRDERVKNEQSNGSIGYRTDSHLGCSRFLAERDSHVRIAVSISCVSIASVTLIQLLYEWKSRTDSRYSGLPSGLGEPSLPATV